MTDTTTTTQSAKRGRNGSVILTDRMCEKRVAKRTKIYDRKCPGLYVSITPAGVATFSLKFTDRATGKQRTGWLGVYNPETFTVEDARSIGTPNCLANAISGRSLADCVDLY
jgi:hypothetical protein